MMAVCCREADFEHLLKRTAQPPSAAANADPACQARHAARAPKKQSAAICGALSCFTETSNSRQAAFKRLFTGTSSQHQKR
jgi:hypothetical protein